MSFADEYYLYAISCLRYAFYTECIKWCDQITSTIESVPSGQVNLIRGKAYAHIHQRQSWCVAKKGMLDVAVPWKVGDFVDHCASNAKKAIRDLGIALDEGVLDEGGSYLLDMAMINHVLIKKQLKDCQRCLLCRRKGVKLKESHTIPKFIYKEMSKQTREGSTQNGVEDNDVELYFNSTSGKFKLNSSNTAMKYTLLCERCEQCLSHNGENQFQKEFMPTIYSGSDETQNIVYDSNTFTFCLGILFRSFVNNTLFFYLANVDEIYQIFVACRQYLIKLSAKITEKKEIPNPPSVDQMRQISLPDTYLIINPSKLHISNRSVLFLGGFMAFGTATMFLITPLNRESKTHLCHGIVVHMAVCNIVVPLSPARTAPLDDSYRIHPHGGVYPVLPEIRRWSATPSGIYEAIVTNAINGIRQYRQVLSGMKTTKGDSRKADTLINTIESAYKLNSLEQGAIDVTSLGSMTVTTEEAELISLFASKSNDTAHFIELLPEGFSVRLIPPNIILKEGYMLLYHIHDNDTNATYFFYS